MKIEFRLKTLQITFRRHWSIGGNFNSLSCSSLAKKLINVTDLTNFHGKCAYERTHGKALVCDPNINSCYSLWTANMMFHFEEVNVRKQNNGHAECSILRHSVNSPWFDPPSRNGKNL